MGLVKRTYTDRETVITAENMNGIQDAILDLEDGLFSVDNDKSGEVIAITDAAKRGFRSLNIFGKTTQDGSPTPDAPVDLVSAGDSGSIGVSVAGKNLMPPNAIKQENAYHNFYCYEDDGLYLIPGTYTASIGEVCDGIYVNAHKDGTSLFKWYSGKSLTFTLTEPTRVWFNFYKEDTAFSSNTANTIQLEIGSIPTAYEPYNGQTLTISTPNGLPGIPVTSGGNYTDANGQQWVCDEIDFFRGVYVKRVNVVGFENAVGWKEVQPIGSDTYRFSFSAEKNPTYLPSEGKNGMCNALVYNNAPINQNDVDNSVGAYSGGGVFVRCDAYETVGDFVAWAKSVGLEVQYPLATPIETPLTEEELAAYAALHTYKDHTTVSNDAGAYMELEYVMDAKKYIDSLIGSAGGGASAGIHNATVE